MWALYPIGCFSPPIVQRMLMVQDKRAVRKVWYTNASLYGLIACMSLLIGLSAIVGREKLGLIGNEDRGLLLNLVKVLFEKNGWLTAYL